MTTDTDTAPRKAASTAPSCWIQTFTGKALNPLDPTPEDISIIDIAHALARVSRYTGHTKQMISVAQHSVFVSLRCPHFPLEGLLHDASEAALNDIARPLKVTPAFAAYRAAEERYEKVVAEKFGLVWPWPAEVTRADVVALLTEKRDLLGPSPYSWKEWGKDCLADPECIRAMYPEDAEELFLNRYRELTGRPYLSPARLRLRRAGRAVARGVRGVWEALT